MPIKYSDSPITISYDYLDFIPEKTVCKGKVNLAALSLYGLYRNAVYDSYKEKPDLAEDIKTRKKEFVEQALSNTNNELYNDPLYHYSVAASLGAMQEWKDPAEKMHAFMAYETVNGVKNRIGFVHFNEKLVDSKPVVYIAQAGVQLRGTGIGRHLMECVLSHYPADTEFYILTRVFNSDAKGLYEKRLGFKPIENEEVRALGFDDRYCGFKHRTSLEEIDAIKTRQIVTQIDEPTLEASSFMP
ncbi:GNAT family N-acetyltransferase [Legionella dresdenensis]|uniref:GNAT family N-acetyltransferase n=1 Tax=Legionella dresdenensis TaxID=450200 RepID=A0ABV8CH38_9GAMM